MIMTFSNILERIDFDLGQENEIESHLLMKCFPDTTIIFNMM